jgi:UDP-glucose 4-epimerase
VYGSPTTLPITEEHEIKPISPYGNTKIAFENVLKDYSHAYGISSICFRYFNTAGAEPFNFDLGQEPGVPHIMAKVLESCIKGTDFYLYGNDYDTADGTGVRDYIHVWDLAMAHILVAENYPTGVTVYNLGGGNGISNQEIINYVYNKYGKFNVIVDSKKIGDPDKLYAHSNKFQKDYKWNMTFTNLNDMLDSAYKWYKRIL